MTVLDQEKDYIDIMDYMDNIKAVSAQDYFHLWLHRAAR